MTDSVDAVKRLGLYGIASAGHGVVSLSAGVLIAGLLYRHLGIDYGPLALVLAAMTRLNLFEDSIGSFLVTNVARLRRQGDQFDRDDEEAARLGVAILGALGAAAVLGSMIGIAIFSIFHARSDALPIAMAGALGLFAAAAASLGARLLEGCEAYPVLRVLQSLMQLARLGVAAVLVVIGTTFLPAFALSFAATFAVSAALALALVVRRLPVRLDRAVRSANAAAARGLWRFMRPLLLAKGVAVVSYRLDIWIVQLVWGAAGSAAYAIAETVAQSLLQLLEVFKVVLPVSVSRWQHQDKVWVERFVLGNQKAVIGVVGAACLVVWANLDVVLTLWFGAVPEAGRIASGLLILFVATTTLRSAVQTILVGQGLFDHLQRPFVVAGLVNAACSVVATYHLGPWGPALGTALAGFVLVGGVLPRAERALGLPGRSLSVLALRTAPLLAGLAVLGALPWSPTGSPLADLVLRGVAVAVAYLLAFTFVVLDGEDREWISGVILRGRAT